MSRAVSGPLARLGCVMPVIAVMAGCADSVPMQPYTYTYTYTSPARDGWSYRSNPGSYTQPVVAYPRPTPAPPPSYSFIPRAEAAPATPPHPPPLRPVDPPDAVPVDQSCGWWRLCNLWNGS